MRFQIALVVIVRSLFFALLIYGLNQIDVLGTDPNALILSTFVGAAISSRAAFSTISTRGFIISLAIVTSLFYSFSWISVLLPASTAVEILRPFNLSLHGELILFAFIISSFSTWGFWRIKDTPTIELVVFVSASILALAGHRDFMLDNPQALSTIAWNLGIDQIYLFTCLGLLISITTLLYLALASLPARQMLVLRWNDFSATRGKRSLLILSTVSLLIISLFSLSFHYIYQYYHQVSIARLNNGVGQSGKEGLSPLGFNSALGSTNQPAALVRLEGDYRENPFTPMLYLREDALSEYNGHEMVIASSTYDTDVAGNTPFEPFDGKEDASLSARIPITQSIYLLADHKVTMSIDYPLTIRPLKNPNPGKFKASFRAYSMAPAFTKEMLRSATVGNPHWSDSEREHYLKTNTDQRYHALAQQLTATAFSPIEKAAAITTYLSEKSTYTLTPNHQVDKAADQTAPYLFGDMRGYCVHFAHAMVYMFRSLGIPSRIGTGYLTDLSQSKDGHILLRMSDRHAWAEVYIDKLGWTPFDIQPAKVESHADTQVDLKMLEELMGLLEPGEEILPKDLSKDEPGFEKDWEFSLPIPSKEALVYGALAIVLLLILCKLYLRFGWIFARTPAQRIRSSYRSVASYLIDLGIHRSPGETRLEYRKRLRSSLGHDALSLAELISLASYARSTSALPSIDVIDKRRVHDQRTLNTLPWKQKMLALVNLSSLTAFFRKGRW